MLAEGEYGSAYVVVNVTLTKVAVAVCTSRYSVPTVSLTAVVDSTKVDT